MPKHLVQIILCQRPKQMDSSNSPETLLSPLHPSGVHKCVVHSRDVNTNAPLFSYVATRYLHFLPFALIFACISFSARAEKFMFDDVRDVELDFLPFQQARERSRTTFTSSPISGVNRGI